MKWLKVFSRLATAYSLGMIVLGRILAFGFLDNHQECDMTWSQRRFLEIGLKSESPYRFFKFTDARDPRHRQFFKSGDSEGAVLDPNDASWCVNSDKRSIPVLFIPGHAGDYQQARSIGAHSVQMTGYSLASSEVKAAVKELEDSSSTSPRLDVYAVDFQEEWTALHGFYALRQTEYVEMAIELLVSTCGFQSVMLLGHSMGGLVGLAAAKGLPTYVNSMVTLATPYRNLVTLEPQLMQWYQSLQHPLGAADLAIVSISGGLRDSLVTPESAQVLGRTMFSLSIMGPDLMENASDPGKISVPIFGMDHRAIVWCRNLLSPVHGILRKMAETRIQKRMHPYVTLEGIKKLVGHHEFIKSVTTQYDSLQSAYGVIGATAIELSTLMRADLVFLFLCVSGLLRLNPPSTRRLLFGFGIPNLVVLVAVILLCKAPSLFSYHKLLRSPSILTLITLSFASDAVFHFFSLTLKAICGRFSVGSRLKFMLLLGVCCFGLCVLVDMFVIKPEPENCFFTGLLLVTWTIGLGLGNIGTINAKDDALVEREIAMTAWIVPLFAVLVAPDLLVGTRLTDSLGVIGNLCPVIGVRFLVGAWTPSTSDAEDWVPLGGKCTLAYYFLFGKLRAAARYSGNHQLGLFAGVLVVIETLQILIGKVHSIRVKRATKVVAGAKKEDTKQKRD